MSLDALRLKPEKNDSINYGSVTLQHGYNTSESWVKTEVPLHEYRNLSVNKLIRDPTLSHIIGKKASSWSIGFSIIKSIVGCGILSLPWATANIGLFPTLILLLLSFIFSLICWIFLIISADRLSVFEFRDIGLKLYGQTFALFIDVILTAISCMYCILYSVYISEFISNGISEYGIFIDKRIISDITITSFHDFISTKFFILTITIYMVLLPLTLLPRLDYLKYSSIIGMVATCITIGYISYNFFTNGVIHSTVKWVNTHNGSSSFVGFWLESFSVFSAGFFGHFNTAALYGELKQRSVQLMTKTSCISFVVILVLNVFIMVTAYLSFGDTVQQNVIESLNNGDNKNIVALLRILMSLNMIGSYPLLFWNIKISLKNLIFYHSSGIHRRFTSNASQRFVYVIINGVIWSISLFANDVAEILSLIQAALGSLILFVFPAMFYMHILKGRRILSNNIKLLCIAIVIFGFIAMFGGIISTTMNMVGYI